MNRKEAMRQSHQEDVLLSLGFTRNESEQLRRISMTLHNWHEKECGTNNGCIERDDAGKAYWLNSFSGQRYPVRDMETGAKKRLYRILDAVNKARLTHMTDGKMTPQEGLTPYIQTDPRGAALYILRPGDVPDGCEVDSYYSRGICVY